MLAKILASHHGFHCTVLFAINPESGLIDPNYNANIPGTEALADADLMILATRWRVLPDEQLEPVYDFLKAGKPVIAFRTATHAFKSGDVGGYDWANFGIQVVGENWHSHHGKHKFQGGRSVTVAKNAEHPILNGVDSFYTPTDIYGVVHLDEEKSTLLLRGAVTVALDPSAALLDDEKNDPMMPLAWLKDYELPGGVAGQCFATTCGAAVDFRSESLRRLLVNASLHLTGQPVPQKANVEFVDPFKPSFFGFMPKDYFTKRGLRVEDFGPGKSAQSVPVAGY
ncbi:MAG: ThuA domain-containing protein [Planctomycetota bacterium]